MRQKYLATLIFAVTAFLIACSSQQADVPVPDRVPQVVSPQASQQESSPAQSAAPSDNNAASVNTAPAPASNQPSESPKEPYQDQQSSTTASNSINENEAEKESDSPIVDTNSSQGPDSLVIKEAEPAPDEHEEQAVDKTESSGGEEADNVVAKATEIESEPSETEDSVQEDSPDPLSDEFFLRVVSPEEDTSFVESPMFEVAGLTPLDAAVSVNDDLVEVDEDGRFGATVELEEGPNIIEVVASNGDGDEEDMVFTVFYIP